MITLKFSILPDSADQQSLILRDETGDYHPDLNPGGYGAPNTERSQVDYLEVTIEWPDGYISSFPLYRQPGYPVQLDALTYSPQIRSMAGAYATAPGADGYSRVDQYPDGIYKVTYGIYSRFGVSNTQCTYLARGAYKDGMKVWAMKNGGWFNITSEITPVLQGTEIVAFTHNPTNTTDNYYLFQVRDFSDDLYTSGEYEKSACVQVPGTGTVGQPQLVAAATQEFCLIGRTLQLIAPKAFATLNSESTTPSEVKAREDIVLMMGQLLYLKEVPSRRRNFETFPVIYSLL